MIAEKFFIQSAVIGQEQDLTPERWYNLNALLWDYDENTVTLCFSLTLDLFQRISSIITKQDELPILWIKDKKIASCLITKIKTIKIVMNEWKKWMLPECYLKLEYIQSNIRDNEQLTTEIDQEHIVREGVEVTTLLTGDNRKVDVECLSICIGLDKNLFPFTFHAVSKYYKDIADNIAAEINTVDNFTIAFEFKKQPDFTVMQVINCSIDDIINKNDKLHIYGSGNDNSQLVFNDNISLDTSYVSIADYFMHLPVESKPMKDKTGVVAFEL